MSYLEGEIEIPEVVRTPGQGAFVGEGGFEVFLHSSGFCMGGAHLLLVCVY